VGHFTFLPPLLAKIVQKNIFFIFFFEKTSFFRKDFLFLHSKCDCKRVRNAQMLRKTIKQQQKNLNNRKSTETKNFTAPRKRPIEGENPMNSKEI